MLRRVRRWTHYEELRNGERETVETHSLTTAWLGAGMLAIEMKAGTHALNAFRILLACAIHDVHEGKTGDVTYDVKNDARVKAGLKEIEHEFVDGIFGAFPDAIRDAFRDATVVEDEAERTLDGQFFNAIERLGYMVFAVPQVKKGRMGFVQVFRNQHAPLLAYGEQFESVRLMYEPYRAYVEQTIRKMDALAIVEDDA